MKKDMPLEGLRWSRDSGSALYDTPPNGRSRTGWGGNFGLIYAEKIDFTPIYAKNYPLAYGFCCTFAPEKIKRRCETLSSSFTYTRITMGFR